MATTTDPPVVTPGPVPRSPAPPARYRRALRAPVAIASGLVLLAAFPPYDVWPLAPVAVALLTLAVRGATARTAFGLGLAAGLAFFVPLLQWSSNVGSDAWLGLAASQAVPIGLLAAGVAVVQRLPGWPLWTAALWVAEEWARSRVPFGGFPWGRLAFSQGESAFTPYAALAGAPGVTFAVALVGGLLAAAIVAQRRSPGALLAVGALAVPLVALAVPGPPPATGTTRVAVVQGNVPRLGLDAFTQREVVLRNHVAATRDLGARIAAGETARPDLVVWPENSSDLDPLEVPRAAAQITDAARAVGAPILVGAVLDGPTATTVRNTGLVWDPVTGPGDFYDKRHPVPFAEYVPFRSVLARLIDRFSMVPRDFVAGDAPGVLDIGGVRLGDVICFEVAYDGIVRDTVRGGGELVVVQTNNATFGRSGLTSQQLAMSRVRAVEHGRTVLVAATSGISAVIAPTGATVESTAVFTRRVLVHDVPLSTGRTLATRLGAVPEWGAAVVALLAVAVAVRRSRS